jgi:hypothetical protein
MANKIFKLILITCTLLSAAVYFIYRNYGWPFGREGIEGLLAFLVFAVGSVLFFLYQQKAPSNKAQCFSLKCGLLIGLFWTIEIGMNNLLRPGLPQRDIYDDIFWAIIAVLILVIAVQQAFYSKKLSTGIWSGFWSGIGSGSIASLTALGFIVFGMDQLLKDPLNLAEWTAIGPSSHVSSMAVYFAFESLAGAVMHFLVLGIGMGVLLGIVGGAIGTGLRLIRKKK